MPQDDKHYIIFIHGFLGSKSNFQDLDKTLTQNGFHTILHEYNTFDGGVQTLADLLLQKSLPEAQNAHKISIITHSMGALLLRNYLSRHKIPKLHRIVMIAPPNHGSEVADLMSQYDWWVDMFGDAGLDLRTSVTFPSMPKEAEFGIIGGTASWNYLSKDWIPGEDDGWVGIQSTKLKGMKDFITVESSHGFITSNESVINQTLYFLHHGHFAANIKMEGTAVDVTSFDKMSAKTGEYMTKVNDWYENLFKEGDQDKLKKARTKLKGQFNDFNEWMEGWQKRQEHSTPETKNI